MRDNRDALAEALGMPPGPEDKLRLPAFAVPKIGGPQAREYLQRLVHKSLDLIVEHGEAKAWTEGRTEELLSASADPDGERAKILSRAKREAKRRFTAEVLKPLRLQIAASAGVGKTTAVANGYRNKPALWRKSIWYFAPTVDLCEQVVRDINENAPRGMPLARVLAGRTHSKNGRVPPCRRAKIVQESQIKVRSVYKAFCDDGAGQRCAFYEQCDYIAARRDQRPGILAFPHANLVVPQSNDLKLPAPDLVIIDERCFDKFTKKSIIRAEELQDRDTYFRIGAPAEENAGYERHAELGRYIAKIIIEEKDWLHRLRADEDKARLDSGVGNDWFLIGNPKSLHNRLSEAASAAAAAAGSNIQIVPTDDDGAVREKLSAIKSHSGRRVAGLFRRIRRDLESPAESVAVLTEVSNGETVIVCHGLRELAFSESTPLLIIDADASERINNRVFSRSDRSEKLRHVDVPVRRHAKFIQCDSSVFSKSGFHGKGEEKSNSIGTRGKEQIDRIAAFAKKVAGDHKRLLMSANKEIRCAGTGEPCGAWFFRTLPAR
ncbi:MAG TPA: hypothetical protein VGM72_00345 [Micropepsaceae bacterium]|jgi:hypothetical protein